MRPRITQEQWIALLDRTAGSIADSTFVRPQQCGCEQPSRTSRVDLEGHGRSFRVVIGPWAIEFDVGATDRCTVVARHPAFAPTLAAEPHHVGLTVTVNESGSTFVFVRNNVVELATPEPVAMPESTGAKRASTARSDDERSDVRSRHGGPGSCCAQAAERARHAAEHRTDKHRCNIRPN